jgi:hypothetical protein
MFHTIRFLLACVAAVATGALIAPVALAAPIDGGERNPSNNASQGYNDETQIIGEIAQNQGGHAAGTGGFVTRQSNKSDSGGGAIYGCRSKAGTEACIAANNLNTGDAFRFQATPNAGTIGQLRFGLDINKTFDKPPFATNGTGMVKNLNADRVDGKSAEDFVEKGTLLFAEVAANGAVSNQRGIAPNTPTIAADDSGDNQTFTVPFASDVSKCVATATLATAPEDPADADDPLVLTVAHHPSNPAMFVVSEVNAADTARPFSIQLTC